MLYKLEALLKQKVIDRAAYDTYILFELEEIGRKYLKNQCEAILLEQPESSSINESYAWHDGRRSVWRDIKIVIEIVKQKLEEYDGSESIRERIDTRNPVV